MNAPNAARQLETADADELNQRWLSARIAGLRERLRAQALGGSTAGAEPVEDESPGIDAMGFVPPLDSLAQLFGLSPFERELLLLAAGYDLDRQLRDLLQRPPSFSLALACLPGAHWDAISPQQPLRYWRLLDVPAEQPPLEAPLRADERILHFMTGVDAFDERLLGVAGFRPPSGRVDAAVQQAAAALAGAGSPLVWIEPKDARAGDAQLLAIAVDAAAAAGHAALVISIADIPGEPRARAELARLLDREAALSDALVVVANDSGGSPDVEPMRQACAFIDALHLPLLVSGRFDAATLHAPGRQRIRIQVASSAARPSESARLCARAVHGESIDAALHAAAAQFQVSPDVVDDCLERIDRADPAPVERQLWRALREASRGGLEQLAQRIDAPDTGLDDLVLPSAPHGQLLEIAAQLRHRHTVYNEWGFAERGSRGLGIAALFCGESGTGKTMAAEAIANHVGLDLYRIDLAQTMNKYIGETEKNLARIFDAAESSGAVLLFDEADALFGKRSEVKDSHDRYANLEVAYLLQRIEAYRGLAILTTNLKSSLDRAFQRRIRFIVNFPFPDEASRRLLWRRQWPARAPLGEIDFDALARLPLAGGHIRSVALNAAFMAADAGEVIGMAHVRRAVQREAAKLDRSLPDGGPAGARALS